MENQIGGAVKRVEDRAGHGTADFSGTVFTRVGAVFVKAVRQDNHSKTRARMEEPRLNKLLPRVAPQLLWRTVNTEWALTGYEYVDGRHARLAPGSDDVYPVVQLVAELAVREVPGSSYFDSLGARWSREAPWRTLAGLRHKLRNTWERQRIDVFADAELYVFDVLSAGTSIANADVSETSVLIRRGGPRIVGWTWATRAPAWVDSAVLAVRLVEAGHTPEQAESWVTHVPAWKEASATALDAFSAALLGLWTLNSQYPSLIDAARRYAAYRLDGSAHPIRA
ncbi:hypothetical protein [Amycolatopsis lurida]|uniref:hypothetical protein n=1 Tax=Amycolatopsis lurida TaxID=31959 RepID=UPI00366676C5